MKTIEIFIKQGDQEIGGNSIVIPSFIAPVNTISSLSSNIKELLTRKSLSLSENSIDLLNLGLAVYTLDQLVSREEFGHYQWCRSFKINLPVLNINLWESVLPEVIKALDFLSGDHWTINLTEREKNYDTEPIRPDHSFQKVCLFSGGLDSFIGAVNILENEDLVLVGHHKKGGYDKLSQEELVESLGDKYDDRTIEKFLFFVQPKKSKEKKYIGEDTQRARSFLFLILGIITANAYGANIPLFVPENGLISLNLPLTQSRLGTFSTKTTHPFFIDTFKSILRGININNDIINPFQFKTKGEMIETSENKELVKELAPKTISCSKTGYYKRWHKKSENHCGHCVPCIIRRAAMKKSGIDSPGDYVFDIRSFDKSYNKDKGADFHAFKIAIYKYLVKNELNIFEVLKSGSLPTDDIEKYLDVARRGLKEVADFINDN